MRFPRRSDEAPDAPDQAHAERHLGERGVFTRLVILGVVVAYAVAFVLENRKDVRVHFVFAKTTVSLIWLILLSLALGGLAARLLPLYRRRRRRH
jgi:uncharacterized integral membrane protein